MVAKTAWGGTMIDFSKYPYAVARIYEDTDDKGFPTVIIKPISLCEDKKSAIESVQHQREYEKQVIMSNPISDLSNYWKADNIRAIKIYEVD